MLDTTDLTEAEVGKKFGLSVSRICQICRSERLRRLELESES